MQTTQQQVAAAARDPFTIVKPIINRLQTTN